MRIESRDVILPVSCSAAFDLLVDYRNDPKWRNEVASVELLSGAAGEPGAHYTGNLDWYGLSVPHGLELIECERPTHIRIRSESPNLLIEVRYHLEARGEGCALNAEYKLDMSGPLVVVEPFGWALLMGWVDDDLPRLPEVLSAG